MGIFYPMTDQLTVITDCREDIREEEASLRMHQAFFTSFYKISNFFTNYDIQSLFYLLKNLNRIP